MPNLLLIRHGESEYNAQERFTGLHDPTLSENGRTQAAMMAGAVKGLKPDVAFTSMLGRAKDTLDIILQTNGWENTPVYSNAALNERDYGDFSGMYHKEIIDRFGEAQYTKFRRGWDEPIPKGETLKMVYRRVILYFVSVILPELKHGNNTLVVAHGNTLRSLIKHLDGLDDVEVGRLELPLAEILVYDYEMRIASKQVRKFQSNLPFVTVNSTYIKY